MLLLLLHRQPLLLLVLVVSSKATAPGNTTRLTAVAASILLGAVISLHPSPVAAVRAAATCAAVQHACCVLLGERWILHRAGPTSRPALIHPRCGGRGCLLPMCKGWRALHAHAGRADPCATTAVADVSVRLADGVCKCLQAACCHSVSQSGAQAHHTRVNSSSAASKRGCAGTKVEGWDYWRLITATTASCC